MIAVARDGNEAVNLYRAGIGKIFAAVNALALILIKDGEQ